MKKKIAIITERANIILGGAERSIFELSMALTGLGHNVEVLAASGQTRAKHIHILCNNESGKRVALKKFGSILKKHIAKNNYDIVHSALPYDFADVYQPRGGTYPETIIQNASSYQNKAVEIYKKVTAFANLRRAGLYHAEKRLCRKPDGPVIATLSQYVAVQFKRHYKINDDRLTVINNGVKIHIPDTSAADKLRSQILSHLHLKEADNPVFFVFAAHNFRLKGLQCLLEALSLANKKQCERPIFLVVAGRGKTAKYRLLARKFKVHKQVIFLGALRNIQNALAITDVAVLPTFYDPASRFILEALAAGRCVITTKFNGATDMFENQRHGIVIDSPENIQALAEALYYFSNTENINKACENIKADNLADKISIRNAAKKLNSLYDDIIAKRSNQ